jgi:uncharacterized protein (TIGR02646 family)
MRKITKAGPPPELTRRQRRNPDSHYNDLTDEERRIVRKACLAEQKGLCAFCCCSITVDTGQNAHIFSKTRYPQRSLDWDNLVAGCTSYKHCGTYQKTRDIPLTPLMPECETELQFYTSGSVKACSPRAQTTIEVLNLDDPVLRAKRKKALYDLLYSSEFHPVEDIPAWDAELVQAFIAVCGKEEDGELPSYGPVLANIIRGFLNVRPCARSVRPPQKIR